MKPVPVDHLYSMLRAQIEGPQTPDRGGLDSLRLREVIEKYRVPGVSVAVIKDFAVNWVAGFGSADVKTASPVDAHTLFQAASISKPVTAMGVLKLAQEGYMALDADMNAMLKSWKLRQREFGGVPVTPRALLSHTSGAGDGFGFPGYDPASPLPTLIQILNGQEPSNLGPVRFERPPFSAFKYSGGGTIIMQLAMMDTLQKSFTDLMAEYVLKPLGMADSTFAQPLPRSFDAKAARAHDWQGNAMDAKWHAYPEQAAAGLWTTPTDLAQVVLEVQRALVGFASRVLDQQSARQMVMPVGVGPYAVGFAVKQRGEGWYFSHGGDNWGFQCRLVAHVLKGYGLVVMTNGGNGGPVIDEIEARVASACDWDSLHKPVPR